MLLYDTTRFYYFKSGFTIIKYSHDYKPYGGRKANIMYNVKSAFC